MILPLLILSYGPLCSYVGKKKFNIQIYMFLCCISIIFFAGMRSPYFGSPDTEAYTRFFDNQKNVSFNSLIKLWSMSPIDFMQKEGGFQLFMWGCAQIFNNSQIFILLTSAIMTLCVARFISTQSDDVTLSWLTYVCLGLMTFNMNGLRQGLAMSICLISYEFAKRRKLLPFLLIVLLAMTFHRSSIIYLLVYPLCNYKPSFVSNIVLSSGVVFFFLFSSQLANLYNQTMGKDYEMESFESGGVVVVLTYAMVLLLSVLYVFYVKGERKLEIIPLGILVLVGAFLYISRYLSTQIFERMSYYFFYFIILLLPKLRHVFDIKSQVIYRYAVIGLAVGLFFYRVMGDGYAFFWQ